MISGAWGRDIICLVYPLGLRTWIIPSSHKVPNSNLATYSKSLYDITQAKGPNLPLNVLKTEE